MLPAYTVDFAHDVKLDLLHLVASEWFHGQWLLPSICEWFAHSVVGAMGIIIAHTMDFTRKSI